MKVFYSMGNLSKKEVNKQFAMQKHIFFFKEMLNQILHKGIDNKFSSPKWNIYFIIQFYYITILQYYSILLSLQY